MCMKITGKVVAAVVWNDIVLIPTSLQKLTIVSSVKYALLLLLKHKVYTRVKLFLKHKAYTRVKLFLKHKAYTRVKLLLKHKAYTRVKLLLKHKAYTRVKLVQKHKAYTRVNMSPQSSYLGNSIRKNVTRRSTQKIYKK